MEKETLKLYQVDAFTNKAFSGNPAAVCMLKKPISDRLMQAIASEMNLSETAFVLPIDNAFVEKASTYSLRWFTPKFEVPLCGHATLAASAVLFDELEIPFSEISYETKSGSLIAKKDEEGIVLDFPLDNPTGVDLASIIELLKALGIPKLTKAFLGERTRKLVIHLENINEVLQLTPNYEEIRQLQFENIKGVAVTARSEGAYDFISRYFNPWAGVNEDPVTGSVHTLLANYWSKLLNKRELKAYQASERGGEMTLRLKDPMRLDIVGKAALVFKGDLSV